VISTAEFVRKFGIYPIMVAGLAAASYLYLERRSYEVHINDLEERLKTHQADYEDKIATLKEKDATLHEKITYLEEKIGDLRGDNQRKDELAQVFGIYKSKFEEVQKNIKRSRVDTK
jgi:multidrug resistance efflux pump